MIRRTRKTPRFHELDQSVISGILDISRQHAKTGGDTKITIGDDILRLGLKTGNSSDTPNDPKPPEGD